MNVTFRIDSGVLGSVTVSQVSAGRKNRLWFEFRRGTPLRRVRPREPRDHLARIPDLRRNPQHRPLPRVRPTNDLEARWHQLGAPVVDLPTAQPRHRVSRSPPEDDLAVCCFWRTPRRLSARPSPSSPDPRRTPHRRRRPPGDSRWRHRHGHSHRRELQSGLEDELAARRLNAESSTPLLPQLTSTQRGAGIGPIRRRPSAGWDTSQRTDGGRGDSGPVGFTLAPPSPWVHAPTSSEPQAAQHRQHVTRWRTRPALFSGGAVSRRGVDPRGCLMRSRSQSRRLSGCCWELRPLCGAARAVRCQGCGRG